MEIEVKPSNNLFAELGNNTYDFKDLLSELIDNSVAARDSNERLHVSITIFVDGDMAPKRFQVSDDASGIGVEQLGDAISPAAIQKTGSLNEHGLGMKQAVAALGTLEFLDTKTSGMAKGVRIHEFRFGKIQGTEIDFPRTHGTTISVVNLKSIVNPHPPSITRSLIPHLGARYRRFLKPDAKIIDLEIRIENLETGECLHRWEVREVKPTYFHPSTRENRPVILRHPIEGAGWRAELTFGYAPKNDEEYEELGVEVPNKFHPYRVAQATQGLDLLFHDR